MNLFRKFITNSLVFLLIWNFTVGANMPTIEKAMIAQASPHMVAARAQELIGEEILKGCRPDITSQPVSLEPNFYPIWALKDKKDSQRQPDYIIENSTSDSDLVRRQIWISPDQKFDWNNSELFNKQLQTISFRLGFEVTGNSENILINLFSLFL